MALFERDSDATRPDAPVTARMVKERWERSVKAMRQERQAYLLNKAFLQGSQWLYWSDAQDTIREHQRDDSRVRVTLNRLRPASRHIISKLLSRELVFEVPPADSDDASIREARTGDAVLVDTHREHKWEEAREAIAWSAWLGGTSVLALDWDPEMGTPLGTTEMGKAYGTGDLRETSLNVLEFGWEPGVKDAERGYYWVKAQALPPCEVQLRYGLKKLPGADANAAAGYLGRDLATRGQSAQDLTLVLTYYERPSKFRPQGAVATVVGEEIVDGGIKPWPFPFKDRLNMVVFRESKADGRATGDTVFSDAVLVQAAYNGAWSSLLEHAKNSGNARLLWPEGAEEIDDLSDLPGEVVSFSASLGKPEWLSPPQLPAWLLEQPAALAAQLDDILGLHDVSRGAGASGVESGVGIAILVEQDATPIGGLSKEIAFGFERFAAMVLDLYRVKVIEPRSARVRTPGAPSSLQRWTGGSLPAHPVVEVPMDAITPRSKAAMLSFAERMVSLGIIDAKARPDVFAKMADLPDQHSMLAGIDPAAHKAERENAVFSQGQPVIPALFDIHDTHIARHNNFRMTARYESMPEDQRTLVDLHIKGHEVYSAQQMGAQVAKAMTHPAMAAVPTADLAPSLPEGFAPVAAEGGMGGMEAAPTGAPSAPSPAGDPPPGTMSEPAL